MKRIAYTYATLKYVHDPVSGESLNVGVIVLDRLGNLHFKVPASLVRIKRAFPNANLSSLRSTLLAIETTARAYLDSHRSASLEQVLKHTLREDEAAIKASSIGAGVAQNVDGIAEGILERFVTRCDFDYEEVERLNAVLDHKVWRKPVKTTFDTAANDDWLTSRIAK